MLLFSILDPYYKIITLILHINTTILKRCYTHVTVHARYTHNAP